MILDGKVALITGASRGIGAAVAKRFAKEGAQVVLVARSIAELEEVDDAIQAASNQATLVPMDLGQLEKIDQLAPMLVERFGKLDIFVGNAAQMGSLRPIAQTPNSQWEDVMHVNLTANHRFIRALDPLLRAAPAGRAVFVTSHIGEQITPYWGAYAISKAALNHMVKLYAQEVAQTNIRVNLIDPGVVRTALRANAYPGENTENLPDPETVTDMFLELASPEVTAHGEIHTPAA